MTEQAPGKPTAALTASLIPRRKPPALHYLALAGPTASGKTAAALAIAQRHPVEIVSVDSALVYRGMDIGSAKPSAAELAGVPHHLINIRDPLHAYSAAEFVRDATQLIADIHARGRWPLLVGGTMLYFKALRDGLDDMPSADPVIRAQIAEEAEAKGWPALHAELAQVDPVTAARLAPADAQRIARALEVYRLTKAPLSSFHAIQNKAASALSIRARGQKSSTAEEANHGSANLSSQAADTDGSAQAASSTCLISLEPADRAWLHQRIAQRFDAMLEMGFLDEVAALRARGDLHPDLPAMRCVGYRQAWVYLDALQARAEPNDSTTSAPAAEIAKLAELRDKGIAATRQLAKRQLTWLRSMPDRQVVPCDAPDALDQVLALADGFCNHR